MLAAFSEALFAAASPTANALSLAASAAASSPAGYTPTPLSMQVRETRKGGDPHQHRIKDNMLLAFRNFIPRLDAVYHASGAAERPDGFEEGVRVEAEEVEAPPCAGVAPDVDPHRVAHFII